MLTVPVAFVLMFVMLAGSGFVGYQQDKQDHQVQDKTEQVQDQSEKAKVKEL